MGVHQIDRLVELLTSKECKDLLTALSSPEENIFQQLKRLLPENNRLDPQPRARRDASDENNRLDPQPRARRDASDADGNESILIVFP